MTESTQRELDRRRREVEALREVARTVNRGLEPAEVLASAVEAVAAAVEVDGVLIRTLEPTSGRLTLAAARGVSAALESEFRVLAFGQGLSGHVVLADQPIVVPDAHADDRFSAGLAAREGVSSAAVVPIHARGRVIGTVAIFTRAPRDFRADDLALLQGIADQVGVALENARLLEAERRRSAELEILNQLKDEFAATVSHELRTPMTVVKTSLDALHRDWDRLSDERRREYLRVGRTGAERLRRLLESLLLVSGIENARVQLRLGAVDVAAVVADVIAEAAQGQPRVFATDLPDALAVRADRARLGDVLGSLVENAVRYSSAPAPIMVAARRSGDRAILEVRDRGIGIAPEDMSRLFQRFERIDRTVRSHTGTGLGLYISRRLIEVMGGRIWATSEPGYGSSFFVELAAAPREQT